MSNKLEKNSMSESFVKLKCIIKQFVILKKKMFLKFEFKGLSLVNILSMKTTCSKKILITPHALNVKSSQTVPSTRFAVILISSHVSFETRNPNTKFVDQKVLCLFAVGDIVDFA